MKTLAELGREVANLRKAQGWTQQRLGGQVGMGQSTIARFESGRVPEFGSVKLLKLLAALGCELGVQPSALEELAQKEDGVLRTSR